MRKKNSINFVEVFYIMNYSIISLMDKNVDNNKNGGMFWQRWTNKRSTIDKEKQSLIDFEYMNGCHWKYYNKTQ